MATTPESIVKRKIKKLLDSYGNRIYTYMPVPSGYGATTVDYLICAWGVFIAVEAKKPGGVPTPRQRAVLEQVTDAGGLTMAIDDDASVLSLKRLLDQLMEGK